MNIFPAIDLYENKAVRLVRGDYAKMTVYNDNPLKQALSFFNDGAEYLHIVDLEGAKTGKTPNYTAICDIMKNTSMFVEVGGGIRDFETAEKYISAGANRVIIGTAAVQDDDFLKIAVNKWGEKIAVGVDVRNGFVATHGWTEVTKCRCEEFFDKLCNLGVETVICTDISKDGVMEGTNLELYKTLSNKYDVNIIASGGVSTLENIRALKTMNLYGAILGKALYSGAINLTKAIEAAK